MGNNTIIIAHRRKGRKMWEGYAEINAKDKKMEIQWRRDAGLVCKTFPDIIAYRQDVEKKCG